MTINELIAKLQKIEKKCCSEFEGADVYYKCQYEDGFDYFNKASDIKLTYNFGENEFPMIVIS